MKNLISLIMAITLSVFSAGAMADAHVAKKGQTSWGIAQAVCGKGSEWKALGLPEVLVAGETYDVDANKCTEMAGVKPMPKIVTGTPVTDCSTRECRITEFHQNTFRGCGRDRVKTLVGHGIQSEAVAQELVNKFQSGQCKPYTIKRNSVFYMMVGCKNDLVGNIRYTGEDTPGKLCVASTGERLVVPDKCENWAFEKPEDARPIPVVAAQRVPEIRLVTPAVSVSATQHVQTAALVPAAEVVAAAEAVLPSKSVALAEAVPAPTQVAEAVPVKPLKRTCSAYEANAGVYAWQNELAEGNGVWGEIGCWHQFEKSPEYSWLIGLFGSNAPGESRISSYDWDESKIALQGGVQRTWLNDKGFLSQWQAKIRLGREWQEGGSPDAYHMKQRNTLLGWYGETFEEVNARGDRRGLMTSGWVDLSSDRSSNAVGWTDKPESRLTAELLGFYEWSLDENWKVRPLAGFVYTGWDEQWWLRLVGEMNYTTDDGIKIAFGPYANLPIGELSKSYPGVDKSDLDTLGVFVRAEFGEAVRRHESDLRTAEFCREYNVKECRVDVDKVLGSEKQANASSAKAPATEGFDILNLDKQIEAEAKVPTTSTVSNVSSVGEGFTFGF